jgi:hypothetical protein
LANTFADFLAFLVFTHYELLSLSKTGANATLNYTTLAPVLQ